MKSLYLDFEFSRVTEPKVNLVCCVTYDISTGEINRFWLHNNEKNKKKLVEHIKQYKDNNAIIGYSTVAESRAFLALGLNPLSFNWIDLFIEYRMMTNHNDRLLYGKQLVDGKVKTFRKPKSKWERDESDDAGFKPTHSLAEATYKLTEETRDTEHKDKMRDLIISDPKEFTQEESMDIMDYCEEDVVFLPKIWKRLKEEYKELCPYESLTQYVKDAMTRGRYSAHTAIMENTGYPIDVEKTRNFSKQVSSIMFDLQRDINSQFKKEERPFRFNKAEQKYTWDQKVSKKWISDNCKVDKWIKTEGGGLSLSLEAWERQFQFKHTYPTGHFAAQMIRYLKVKQSLYGFSDTKGKRKNFWDSVGSDGRVRPYMNHFGAQSSRSQPAASGFMFLKPAWMRSLVVPSKDKFIASIDYGQQEFFISALESGDKNMIDAYLSGDPYLYGAKLAGAIPKNGTRETHKIERDLFKNTYLGILYGMTKYGLSVKLTNDTGRTYTEEDAQEQIDLFEQTFPDYMQFKEEIGEAYLDSGGIVLPCGWKMFGDNENIRSVYNVPVQGFGASVMRKAVDLAVGKSCRVIFTLHDAIYIEDSVGREEKIKYLADAMREAFIHYVDEKYKKIASNIKLDPYAWSPSYEKDSTLNIDGFGKVPCSNLYIDERASDEYEKFSKYFETPDSELL